MCFQAHRRKFEKLKSFMNFDMIYKYNFQVLSSSSSQNNFYNNHTSQCTNAIYQLHKRSMLLLPYILRWIEDTILGPRNHLDQHWDRVSVQSTPPKFLKFESFLEKSLMYVIWVWIYLDSPSKVQLVPLPLGYIIHYHSFIRRQYSISPRQVATLLSQNSRNLS